MAVVGRALAGLPDPEARARVLRWAVERFEVGEAAGRSATAARGAEDPALTVDGADLFGRESVGPDESLTLPCPSSAPVGVESLMRGFVTDFQRLVVEWQGA
jgi:hypothetical protein